MQDPGPARSWIALAVAVSCWTLSPLLVFESAGLARSPIVALYAVALGATFALVALARSERFNVRTLIAVNRDNRAVGKALFVGAGAFVAYPLLYFSALQSAHSITLVNLVNYLWPIIGIALVATRKPQDLSLEIILAVGFGFAGAAIAITTAHGAVDGAGQFKPFLLAGLGAVVYGGVSAYMRLNPDRAGAYHTQLLILALLSAGLISLAGIGLLALAHAAWLTLHATPRRVAALLLYAALLPLAHLSWLTAVQDSRVPTFPSAFVIPVTGTAVLALAVSGQASPAVLSALVLVLCGIAFATMSRQTVPFRFAVTLAFLASVQVSQGLAGSVHGAVDAQTSTLAQVLVALLAIFGGFAIANAIRRHNALQFCCASFYGKIVGDTTGLSQEAKLAALDCLDALVLESAEQADRPDIPPADRDLTASGAAATIAQAGGIQQALAVRAAEQTAPAAPRVVELNVLEARRLHPEEWAKVDVSLATRVSRYEWLVLLLGSSGVVLAGQFFAVDSRSATTIILRAFIVAVTAGLVFAIRDYDKHRPGQLNALVALREGFGLEIGAGSPLDQARRHGGRRALGPWEIVGLTILIASALIAIALNLGS